MESIERCLTFICINIATMNFLMQVKLSAQYLESKPLMMRNFNSQSRKVTESFRETIEINPIKHMMSNYGKVS